MRTFFILLSLLLITASLRAQHPHPAFKQYTVAEGLPSSDVYQVTQDSKGYIWFATGNGVSRFNGYEFENFSMSDGLPDNTVFEIYEDNAERIWFLPISCKLSYFYKGKIYVFPHNDVIQKVLQNRLKTSFCVDKQGNVFIGIFRDAIYQITPTGSITRFPNEKSCCLSIIQPDEDHFVYALKEAERPNSINHGIKFITKQIKGIQQVVPNVYSMNATTRVVKSHEHTILLSGNKDLFEFRSLNNFSMIPFPFRIQGVYEDNDNDLWISTFLGGVYFVHKRDFKNKSCYLQGLAVTSVIQDKEGGFWFTTEGNGVFYSPSKKILTYDNASGINNDKINCLATDSSVVFAGNQSGVVYAIGDSICNVYNINTQLPRVNNISALYYNSADKHLWVSGKTETGSIYRNVYKQDDDDLHFGFFNEVVVHDGIFYIACSGGVDQRYTDSKLRFPAYTYLIRHKRVNAVLWSKKNTLLTGEVDGLWEYDFKAKQQFSLGKKNQFLANRVLNLAYTIDSMLVVGTKGSGLIIVADDTTYTINKNNKLCGDNVYKVCCEGNNIWAATDNGLSEVTITGKKPFKYTIKNYTVADGIASNEVNSVLKLNGKIWAATNKGISVFEPLNESRSATKIPLYITKVAINDSLQPVTNEYGLTYSQNNIKIDFTGLGYKNAGKLQYRYKMDGLDTSWTYTDNRQVQYTTLPPNSYYFHLSVLNSNGEWSESGQPIHFMIYYPFWQKWWFRAGVFTVLLSLGFLLFRYRINLVKKQEAKNSELNKTFLNLKMKALRAQMNPHFTFNVMNSIQHFIINQDNESAQRYLSKFSRLLRSILNNSESNMISIAEEIKGLELYLELEAMRFDNRFAYQITIDKKIDTLLIQIPSMLIQPYVENAIKHGILPLKENGTIKIGIFKEGSLLKCVIEDNGIGRKKAEENNKNRQHQSMGTSLTKERLMVINELHNSQLSETIIDLYDENENATGTRIEIHIPIN